MSQNTLQQYYDKRVSSRWIEKGKITQDQYEAHISALPDLAGTYEDISEIVYATEEDEAEKAEAAAAAEAPADAAMATTEAAPVTTEAAYKTPSILPVDDDAPAAETNVIAPPSDGLPQ